jgi:hypothetical protein
MGRPRGLDRALGTSVVSGEGTVELFGAYLVGSPTAPAVFVGFVVHFPEAFARGDFASGAASMVGAKPSKQGEL